MKLKIRNLVSPLYITSVAPPRGDLRTKIKKACDDLPVTSSADGRDNSPVRLSYSPPSSRSAKPQ